MDESQNPATYTEPAVDVTIEMMSPATTALLADMAVDVSLGHENNATNNRAYNYNDGSSKSKGFSSSSASLFEGERVPFHPIQKQKQRQIQNRHHHLTGGNSNSGGEKSINCNNVEKFQASKIPRTRGPNEENYFKNHNDFVVKTINHYSTRIQSNLASLPEYKSMSTDERRAKLEEVDSLLSRLSGKINDNEGEGTERAGQFDAVDACSMEEGDSAHSTILEEEQQNYCQRRTRESIGSETTLEEKQNLEEHDRDSNDNPDNTTLASDVSASILDESTILLSEEDEHENKSKNELVHKQTSLNTVRTSINERNGKVNQTAKEEEDESRFSAGFSEENFNGSNDIRNRTDHDPSVHELPSPNTKADAFDLSSIEQTRHYQLGQHNEYQEGSNIIASPSSSILDGNKISMKRCASNSGKRGSKSRYRSNFRHGVDNNFDDDEFCVENEFDSGYGNGGDDENCDDDDLFRYRNPHEGLFINDNEDGFSCGSPIMRRFSEDGLGLEGDISCCSHDEEGKDVLRDLQQPQLKNAARHTATSKRMIKNDKIGNQKKGNESEDESRFSCIDDDFADPVDFGRNNNANEDNKDDGNMAANRSSESTNLCDEMQQCFTQKSQWSAFRNADPKLTYCQIGSDEEDSPVRRRAIRFNGTSQSRKIIPKSSSGCDRSCARDESIAQIPLLEEPDDVEVLDARSLEDGNDDIGCVEEQDFFEMQEQLADMSMDSELPANQLNNIEGDDPIQTVRNLSRRAKELERRGVDTSHLDEVAPCDIRLKDGTNFRMNPLCFYQGDNGKRKEGKGILKSNAKSTKKDQRSKNSTKAFDAKENENLFKMSNISGTDRTSANSSSYNSSVIEQYSYPDPIANFPSRVVARLNIAYEFIVYKECIRNQICSDNRGVSSAILLSMSPRQVKSVVSKLLMQTAKLARSHQNSRNDPYKEFGEHTPSNRRAQMNDYLAGGTLLVMRGKEDIPDWEVSLREFTSLSVLNHATMQSTSRKQASTAPKCAGFDVVLTTYDAIKSKEATIPIDSNGCAILRQAAKENLNSHGDEWLTTRTSGTQSAASQPQKCQLLSILHRMSWFRVILIDELGRRGFVTKPGTGKSFCSNTALALHFHNKTSNLPSSVCIASSANNKARAQAAVALNSKSRCIFFEKDETTTNTALEDKFKDDRRQLRAVATALQLPETTKLDTLMNRFVLDINKACRNTESNVRSALSSSSDDYFSDSSADDQLTDPL